MPPKLQLTLRFIKRIPEQEIEDHFELDSEPRIDEAAELPSSWTTIFFDPGGKVYVYRYVNEATEVEIFEVVEDCFIEDIRSKPFNKGENK